MLRDGQQVIGKVQLVIHNREGTTVNAAKILARLRTKRGHYFRQAVFDEDLKMLAEEYDRIEPVVETNEGEVELTLNLWPKPLLRSVTFEGNGRVSTRTLEGELGIGALTEFDRLAFNEAFHKLKAFYMKKGFFEAELDYRVEHDLERNEVAVVIEIREGRSGKINEILLINFTPEEESEVLKEMVTKQLNRFTVLFTDEGTYSEEAVQQDRLIITNYLQNQGYADATVEIKVEDCAKKNRIDLIITADKGERYFFGALSFDGNCVLDADAVTRLFLIHPGEPFSNEKIRENLESLKNAYGRIGYIDSIVDFQTELVPGENRYNVHFEIEEGSQYRVGLIRVFGNTTTHTSVILHEALLSPGELFNITKLKDTEEKLLNIGYFKHVNAYVAKSNEISCLEGNYRDVYIEVEETETGKFNIFLGYSSVEEIFGGVTLTEQNFNFEGLGSVWKKGLKNLRGGGEYLNISAQIGQKSSNYALSWTKPHFRDTQWTFGFDLSQSSTRYISKAYDLKTVAVVLRSHYDLNPFLRFGVQYRLKNGWVDLHDHGSSISGLDDAAHIHGLISAIGASLDYDSCNRPIKPTKGFRSRLFAEYAGLGGDHSFFGLGYFNAFFYPLGSRAVLKYRADFRFIQPLGNTHFHSMPLDERLFLGGEFEVRGYRPYRLGPQFEKGHVPEGGLSLQFYSVQLTRRFMKDIELFTFFDAANLSEKTWEMGRMSVSVGYGINFKLISSIPPITMGMGYPVNARNSSEVKRFFFSAGGNF